MLASMEGQMREVIRQKIVDAPGAPIPPFTQRDIRVLDRAEQSPGCDRRASRGQDDVPVADRG